MSYLIFVLRNLLFVGGVTVAIAAGAKLSPIGLARLEAPQVSPSVWSSESWPDTWPMFLVGAAAAAAGLVVWRQELAAEKRRRMELLRGQAQAATPHVDASTLMLQLVGPLEQLNNKADQFSPQELMRRVDELLEAYVLPVVNDRQDVQHQYGLQRGAEILIALAYAERMLNRCWSAAADGYIDEAREALDHATDGMHEVRLLVEQYRTA